MAHPLVITLVHGTFAPAAPWARDDSMLSRELRLAFPDVRIASFEWSGKNSMEERYNQGERLADQLIQQQAMHKGTLQIVVAHSHGGSIAAYALEQLPVFHNVIGLVCLATPFIHLRLRGDFAFIRHVVSLACNAMVLTSGAIISQMFSFPWWAVLIWLVVALFIGAALTGFVNGGASNFETLAEPLCDRMNHRIDPSTRLLLVRALGDEASTVLTVTQFLSLVITQLWRLLAKLESPSSTYPPGTSYLQQVKQNQIQLARQYKLRWVSGARYMRRARKVAAWSLVCTVCGVALFCLETGFYPVSIFALSLALAGGFGILIILMLMLTFRTPVFDRFIQVAAVLLSFLVLPINSFAFGVWVWSGSRLGTFFNAMFVALFVDAVAETTPVGNWPVHQLGSLPQDRTPIRSSLAHSVYLDPRASELIIDWIRDLLTPLESEKSSAG